MTPPPADVPPLEDAGFAGDGAALVAAGGALGAAALLLLLPLLQAAAARTAAARGTARAHLRTTA